MNVSMREQLLGYLLDALDEAERREVERKLATDEHWRVELDSLRLTLEPLSAAYENCDPPPDLAERTCSLVAEHADAWEVASNVVSRPGAAPPLPPPSGPWSLADLVVAVGVCVIAALLFFPAISNSRYAARLAACQNNLRQVGLALANYSDAAGGGYFPGASSYGNRACAGIYAPILLDAGFLSDARVVICPASSRADGGEAFRIPTLLEIDSASSDRIAALQDRAGGSYGYSLGVMVAGRHFPPRNLGREFFPLMSDTPVLYGEFLANADHLGRGLNMLYEDGHVAFCNLRDERPDRDDPFRNRRGVVEAGLDEDDAVIGRSIAPPFPHAVFSGAAAP